MSQHINAGPSSHSHAKNTLLDLELLWGGHNLTSIRRRLCMTLLCLATCTARTESCITTWLTCCVTATCHQSYRGRIMQHMGVMHDILSLWPQAGSPVPRKRTHRVRGASLSPRGKAEAEGAQAGEPGDGSAAAAGEQQGTPGKPEEEADSSAPLSPVSELSPRESGLSPRGSRDGEYAALTPSG